MKFWASAGKKTHQTAETHDCFGAVIHALGTHLLARASYKTELKEWQEAYDEADDPAEKRNLLRQKPIEPTSANLKTLIGQHICEKFPCMKERRHIYQNLLQVLLLRNMNQCRLPFAFY